MMRTKTIALVVVLLLVIGACGNGDDGAVGDSPQRDADAAAEARDPIKIGVIIDRSGPTAGVNAASLAGIELATEQINAEGGINGRRVELVVGDDQANAQESVALAIRFLERENVVGILGPMLTGGALGVINHMRQSGRFAPMIGTAGATSILHDEYEIREWYFAAGLDIQRFAAQMAEVLIEETGAQTAGGMFTTVEAAEQSMDLSRERVIELGVEWVGQEGIDIAATDVFANAQRLRNAGAEAVINWLVAPPTALGWMRAREQLDWDVPWSIADFTLSAHYDSVPELIEGTYVGGICDPRTPRAAEMRAAYEEAHGRELALDSYDSFASMYNAAHLMFDAIARADEVTPLGVRDALEATDGFESYCATAGATTVRLSPDDHAVTRAYPFFEFTGGERRYLGG